MLELAAALHRRFLTHFSHGLCVLCCTGVNVNVDSSASAHRVHSEWMLLFQRDCIRGQRSGWLTSHSISTCSRWVRPRVLLKPVLPESDCVFVLKVLEAIDSRDGPFCAEMMSFKHPHVANPRLQVLLFLTSLQYWLFSHLNHVLFWFFFIVFPVNISMDPLAQISNCLIFIYLY